ncbi:dihydrolipoyl dehydrogenase [uncultured Desulfobacter sp.]|uniref:dihydrolipoyl dehydrogenase n=1 Tax=uncultured Desulfobacter sp. TaxID=240139 RepID=UPI002AAB0F83|nr:dihydrolipoyl dehydrogenase [uncultured Desulfobacter sp.]
MSKEYDVAIIGAGTAGLTAQEEVVKHTDNYVLIDDGPLGTTCARVGCMPSKALIAVADDFHKCSFFDEYGIDGSRGLIPDHKRIMARVRSMRDEFSGGVIQDMSGFMDKVIRKRARFLDANTLDLGDETIRAKSIIIATGSKPFIPDAWLPFKEFIIDTDQFFELETLPRTMAVFGLGVIGIELGQALHRIGVQVTAVSRRKTAGGLTDPKLAEYAFDHFSREMHLELGTAEIVGKTETGLTVGSGSKRWNVDRVLIATGRRPMLQGLGLENLKVDLDDRGMPVFAPQTLQVGNLPVFLAGDANGLKPILHEAADDGTIAGYNACAGTMTRFKKRTPLHITFSSPDIAIAGLSYKALTGKGIDFVVGEASWEELGRARMILGKAAGRARIYAEPHKGRLLGAEIMAPAGEHMAHLLAWTMGANLTIKEILGMPFYHPVPEEALLDAFLQIAAQISEPVPMPILEKIKGGSHGR